MARVQIISELTEQLPWLYNRIVRDYQHGDLHMSVIFAVMAMSRGLAPAGSGGPEPLPLLFLASLFLLTSWIMRRASAKN